MARKAKIDNAILKYRQKKKDLKRGKKSLPLRKYYLIVSEGEKTEPNYFESYKKLLPKHLIELEILGTGESTLKLLNTAIKESEKREYDEVWIVFDKDSFPKYKFDNTIFSAKAKKIKCAYSNEAFEIWYLLHFVYYNTGISREEYKKKLSELLGFEYKKNDPDMYEYLKSKQKIAIENAKRLYLNYDHKSPAKENPSTTVYKLIIELNEYIK